MASSSLPSKTDFLLSFCYFKTYILEKKRTENLKELAIHCIHLKHSSLQTVFMPYLYFSEDCNRNILQLLNVFSGFLMGLHVIFKKLNAKLLIKSHAHLQHPKFSSPCHSCQTKYHFSKI